MTEVVIVILSRGLVRLSRGTGERGRVSRFLRGFAKPKSKVLRG